MAKIGYSTQHVLGDGYTHYDSKGHKTVESRRNWAGGYTDYTLTSEELLEQAKPDAAYLERIRNA
ncbi:MAG: hypothetical protein IJ206_04415 [Oscillospiraceae bacterium]|nr:hypothetical protein [Oscillospiraceae bacterium]